MYSSRMKRKREEAERSDEGIYLTCICGHSRDTLTKPHINFDISRVLESFGCIVFAPHA